MRTPSDSLEMTTLIGSPRPAGYVSRAACNEEVVSPACADGAHESGAHREPLPAVARWVVVPSLPSRRRSPHDGVRDDPSCSESEHANCCSRSGHARSRHLVQSVVSLGLWCPSVRPFVRRSAMMTQRPSVQVRRGAVQREAECELRCEYSRDGGAENGLSEARACRAAHTALIWPRRARPRTDRHSRHRSRRTVLG